MEVSNNSIGQNVQESTWTQRRQHQEQSVNKLILLVEDDQTLAALEAEILAAYGYTVITTYSGERALDILYNVVPDLVVLDIELEHATSGWDILIALQTVTTNISVLLTTSSLQAVRTYRRTHQGNNVTLDYLTKPYPMQTFLKRVQRMLMLVSQ